MGITIDSVFGSPKTNKEEDIQAAADYMDFDVSLFKNNFIRNSYLLQNGGCAAILFYRHQMIHEILLEQIISNTDNNYPNSNRKNLNFIFLISCEKYKILFLADHKQSVTCDIIKASFNFIFQFGWFAHPVLSGNYPPIMIEKIGKMSKEEGFEKSRLPEFTQEEIKMINGSYDFFGLNHYTSVLCSYGGDYPVPSQQNDRGTLKTRDPSWKVCIFSHQWL